LDHECGRTNQKQLTTDPREDSSPLVSPDGRIHRLQLNAWSTAERLADERSMAQCETAYRQRRLSAGHHAGQQIDLFTSWRTTKMSLWRMSIDGGAARADKQFCSLAGGSISPDGKWMACRYRNEDPNSASQIILLPVEGGPPDKIYRLPPRRGGFSPVGFRWKITRHCRQPHREPSNLWSLPLDGGPMKQLTDFKPDSIFAFGLQLSGGGKLGGDVPRHHHQRCNP
jgi:hypothetical protein